MQAQLGKVMGLSAEHARCQQAQIVALSTSLEVALHQAQMHRELLRVRGWKGGAWRSLCHFLSSIPTRASLPIGGVLMG